MWAALLGLALGFWGGGAFPARAASIRSVQTGEVAMSSTPRTVSITAVDAGRAFVLCTNRTNSSNPTNRATCTLTSTAVTITTSAANASEVVRWHVVEFEGGVLVQRGTTSVGSTTTLVNQGLTTAVDTAKSFVLTSERMNSTSRGIDEQWTTRARLTSGTNLELSRNESGTALTVAWQVVQMEGASVQRGLTTIAAGLASATASIGSVDPATSFLLLTRRAAAATNGVETRYQVRGGISGPTTLTFSRDSTTNSVDVAWEVVSLSDGSSVQRGTATASTTETLLNAGLSPAVVLGRSLPFISVQGGVDVTSDLDSTSWTAALSSPTNLELRRGSAQSVDANVGWQVVQFFQCAAVADAAYVAANARSGQATVYWSSPDPVLILRKAGGAFGSELPDNGKAYAVGDTGGELGSAVVVYNGSVAGTSFTQTSLTNGTTYYYKVFPRTGSGGASCYAPGIEVNARPVLASTGEAWSYMMAGGSILRGGTPGDATIYTSSNASWIISLGTADGTQSWEPLATTAAIQGWLSWLPVGGYQYRRQITVTTGPASPQGGYSGYTVRLSGLDTAALVSGGSLRADCNDLRIFWWNGAGWTELARHVIDCNTAATDVRFMLRADIAPSSSDGSYYLYYGNPRAGAPPAVGTTNVYLWWDDATADREASYTQGRIDDSAHGSAWGNTVAWDAAGYYTLNTGDNFAESLRPAGLTERDVYVEYEFYHTAYFPNNMTSGPVVRWTGSGAGGTEVSSGHYYYELAWSCLGGSAYASHDDVTQTNRGSVVLANGTLGCVAANAWTRVGLAAWLVNPTNLKAWFDTTPTEVELGGFGVAGRFGGTHAAAGDTETAGQAGAWLQQEAGRVRNILIRRYVEPEPSAALGAEEATGAGTVVGGDQSGRVYSVDTASGTRNWEVLLAGADAIQATTSAQLRDWSDGTFQATHADDLIFVATRNASSTNNKVFALRASDASLAWTFNDTGAYQVDYIVGQPWVDYRRNRLYVASRAGGAGTQQSLWVISTLDGTLVTSFALGHLETSPTMSYGGSTLWVANAVGELYAIDLDALALKWTSPAALGAAINGFVWEDWDVPERLYFATTDGNVWCLDDPGAGPPPNPASPVWKTMVAGASTPVVLDALYVGSSDGRLHQLNLATGADEKQITVGDGTATVGDASTEWGTEVFVGTTAGKLYKFPLPLP